MDDRAELRNSESCVCMCLVPDSIQDYGVSGISGNFIANTYLQISTCICLNYLTNVGLACRLQRSDISITRSTQRAQTSAECQHNRIVAFLPGSGMDSRIRIVGLYATPQLSIKFHQNPLVTFDNLVNADFGLRTPGSGR